MDRSRRSVLQLGLFTAACACAVGTIAHAQEAPGKFVCPPCDCGAHTAKGDEEFAKPGDCPHCSMPLVPKAAAEKPATPKFGGF